VHRVGTSGRYIVRKEFVARQLSRGEAEINSDWKAGIDSSFHPQITSAGDETTLTLIDISYFGSALSVTILCFAMIYIIRSRHPFCRKGYSPLVPSECADNNQGSGSFASKLLSVLLSGVIYTM
jgi:hypothetical protein